VLPGIAHHYVVTHYDHWTDREPTPSAAGRCWPATPREEALAAAREANRRLMTEINYR
jgi:hypothetical protein